MLGRLGRRSGWGRFPELSEPGQSVEAAIAANVALLPSAFPGREDDIAGDGGPAAIERGLLA